MSDSDQTPQKPDEAPLADEPQLDETPATEDDATVTEIDGDEDLDSAEDRAAQAAPHESESLEEPVLNAEGDVVPVPGHDDADFTEPDVQVYDHQTDFGTGSDEAGASETEGAESFGHQSDGGQHEAP